MLQVAYDSARIVVATADVAFPITAAQFGACARVVPLCAKLLWVPGCKRFIRERSRSNAAKNAEFWYAHWYAHDMHRQIDMLRAIRRLSCS